MSNEMQNLFSVLRVSLDQTPQYGAAEGTPGEMEKGNDSSFGVGEES